MSISQRAIAAACMAAMAAPAAGQGGSGWYGIGQAPAQPDAGSVTIAARGEPRNREIMVCIDGHAMRLLQATLHLRGGGTQSFRLNERVADGGCSRGRGLSGTRIVESAEITYDTAILAGGTARVQLFVR